MTLTRSHCTTVTTQQSRPSFLQEFTKIVQFFSQPKRFGNHALYTVALQVIARFIQEATAKKNKPFFIPLIMNVIKQNNTI